MLRLLPFVTTAFCAIAMSACVSIPYDPGPEDVPGFDVPFARIDVGPFPRVGAGEVLEFALDELDEETWIAVWSVGDAALRFEEISLDPPVTLTGDLPPRDLAVEAVAHLEADFASAGLGEYELRVVTDDYDLPEVVLTVRVAN